MARFLCVVPPFVAHVIQMRCVAAALEGRGNEVAWVAHNAMRRYLPADAVIFEPPRGDRDLYAQALERSRQPFLAGFQSFWQDMLLPLAETMLPTVEQAVADYAPDVMFVDQQALAGALVARKLGLRWATSSPSALLVTRDIEVSPQFQRWVASLYEQLQRDAGLEPQDDLDLSPHLVIIYSSALMATGMLPEPYRLVGPPLDGRKEEPFDAGELRPGRRVYVSLGTSGRYDGNRTFDVVREAFADDDLQVIVAAPEGMLSEPPANFLVRDWLPQVEVMRHVDAAIIHGGSNTTNEALAAGLPLVILPLAFDQFGYADRVAELGAGIRLRHRRVTPAELRSSLHEVMEKPSYRQAAQRIQQSFREAGGAAAASIALESLAANSLAGPGEA